LKQQSLLIYGKNDVSYSAEMARYRFRQLFLGMRFANIVSPVAINGD
jgi:hypothetical protein